MIRILPRRTALAVALAAIALAPAARALAAPALLADSTFVEQWTLRNGLRVTARHIPHARGVAIAVGYGTGSASDPAGREGLSWLLAESEFTAAAGDVPERSRDEMPGLRPLGWQVKVLPRATTFIEMASPRQFPGVLHQTAARMRGVQPTPEVVQRAVERVRGDLAGLFRDNPDSVAYALPRELAAGRDAEALRRLATGDALGAVPPRELERLLAQRFVPSNAALALVGDLGSLDLHAFVEREFGSIPAGVAPAPAPVALRPATLTRRVSGLAATAGTVGILAPAITDADHPEFFISALLMGSRALALWGRPLPPLQSRFKFSLFDDPDLVRFFPPMDPEQGDTTWLSSRLEEVLDPMSRAVMPPESVDDLKRGVFWMLGGPMVPELLVRSRNDMATLSNLAATMAMRALWQPEAFWADYRARFAAITTIPTETWVRYSLDRRHQVRLVLEPARAR